MSGTAPPPPAHDHASGPSGPRAGFGARLLATLIDFVVFLALGGLLTGLLYLAAGETGAWTGYLIAAFLIPTAYHTYFEGRPAGQTPGKRLCKIRVIDARNGGPIGYGRAFGRWLFEWFISSSVCWLGYLWMLWDREKQTWHDKVTSSLVVPTSAYPVD